MSPNRVRPDIDGLRPIPLRSHPDALHHVQGNRPRNACHGPGRWSLSPWHCASMPTAGVLSHLGTGHLPSLFQDQAKPRGLTVSAVGSVVRPKGVSFASDPHRGTGHRRCCLVSTRQHAPQDDRGRLSLVTFYHGCIPPCCQGPQVPDMPQAKGETLGKQVQNHP